jgi:hypothetical protein
LALMEVTTALSAGDTTRLEYRRGSNRRTVSLVLEQMQPEIATLAPTEAGEFMRTSPGMVETVLPRTWEPQPFGVETMVDGPYNGQMFLRTRVVADLELAPMNEGLGQYFGTTTGVLVISVPQGSRLNLRNGDVVQAVDGRKVVSPNQFFRILRSYDGEERFRFEVIRMKRREVVTAKLAND